MTPPILVLFDWHATLADTMDAMYAAMDDMLAELPRHGLQVRLTPPERSKTEDDRKLVAYVRRHHRLHPKLKTGKKVSRTDLLEVLFGPDEDAKRLAHHVYNECYRNHYGDVAPFESGIRDTIETLIGHGVKVGILTNRTREFLEHELAVIEPGGWTELFDIVITGDDVQRLKPAPDPILLALKKVDLRAQPDIWYVGDSTTDTIAAKSTGITNIFYNGAKWDQMWINKIFPGDPSHPHRPDWVVNDFTELLTLITTRWERLQRQRAEALWPPKVILFDWHATLVDTLDAMYHAVDDMLTQLEDLGLVDRLVDPGLSKNVDDRRLVEYVKANYQLHPKIKAARKISRTDIFEIMFGADVEAKQIAHEAFNHCYRHYYGEVEPFEPGVPAMLRRLRALGIKIGVLSNRDREFLLHELEVIEKCGWLSLFDTVVAGDDTIRRKPDPDPIVKAMTNLGMPVGPDCWYVGDSTTDIVAAKNAGVTSVFYNGARWDKTWLAKIFPGTKRHPHRPDIVVENFQELGKLVDKIALGEPQQCAVDS